MYSVNLEALRRRPVLVTGATGGLGRQTARALVARGCPVIIGGRNEAKLDACAEELERAGASSVDRFHADLSDLGAVRAALDAIDAPALSGIVSNAGVSSMQAARSAQDYELTFAVNVLAPQLILRTLARRLVDGSRVVVVSSGVHDPDNKLARRFGIPIPDWVGTRNLARPDEAPEFLRQQDGRLRYATSKLGNVLQARGLQSNLDPARGIDVFAIDPGLMVDTDLAREFPGPARAILRAVGRMLTPFVPNMRLSPESAQHIASLILDSEHAGKGFQYFDGADARPPSPDALRDELMEDLWTESAPLIGLRIDSSSLQGVSR